MSLAHLQSQRKAFRPQPLRWSRRIPLVVLLFLLQLERQRKLRMMESLLLLLVMMRMEP